MRSLFRSEPMALCQLFMQSEAVYQCVAELGEIGRVQFQDLNAEVNAFQRKFVNDIRRCDDMERQLRFVEKEIISEDLPIAPEDPNIEAPLPKEMIDMESMFGKIEEELRQVNQNVNAMTRTYVQLKELKHVLASVDAFFQTRQDLEESYRRGSVPRQSLTTSHDSASALPVQPEQDETLNFLTGTIPNSKFQSFERMLWRVGRGIIFCHRIYINEVIEEADGEEVRKSVFIVFFPGEQLKQRVKKICEAFRANVYPCPASAQARREASLGVIQRIEDMQQVFNGSRDHRMKVLANSARKIRTWIIRLAKMKSVFHVMNMLNFDVTQKCLIAECWIPENDMNEVQAALRKGTEAAGSSFPCIINRLDTKEAPPTFYNTNKFTNGFQQIVNAYGVGNYGELNPAPYAIITFPFLFAVMFGDTGHGILMTLIALALIAYERPLSKIREEIVATFFGGRYLILFMGIFSIYTGLIYNDFFSKPLSIFSSTWILPAYENNTAPAKVTRTLLPERDFKNTSYPFGLDPIWMLSTNKIQFTNSYKMKMAVIMGVLQMGFGTVLSLMNYIHFGDTTKLPPPRSGLERVLRQTLSIWAQFVPEITFLMSLFGYLVFMIIYKWLLVFGNPDYDSSVEDLRGAGCSRSLLMLFINMFMPQQGGGGKAELCYTAPLYAGASVVETLILVVVLISVPWLLLAKPLYLLYLSKVHARPLPEDFIPVLTQVEAVDSSDPAESIEPRKKSTVSLHTLNKEEQQQQNILMEEQCSLDHCDEEHEKFDFGDVFIHQVIHTIEYCLGAVSNTASYLRLWALSLAHAQLSEVLWSMIFSSGIFMDPGNGNLALSIIAPIQIYGTWFLWAFLTLAILLIMEGLSAFLHALRLHWVEFMNKFFSGEGYLFTPFDFKLVVDAIDE